MKRVIYLFSVSLFGFSTVQAESPKVPSVPNGIEFPADYLNWLVISMSRRVDNNSMRVILGNDVAIEAAREGRTNPWPDGAVLGKVVWKAAEKVNWKVRSHRASLSTPSSCSRTPAGGRRRAPAGVEHAGWAPGSNLMARMPVSARNA